MSNADRIASVKAFIYEAYDGAFLRRRKRSVLKRTWRSFVRENVDELLKIPESDPCYLESRKTIVAVVDLLEYGRNYYVFSFTGSDPVEQVDEKILDIGKQCQKEIEEYKA